MAGELTTLGLAMRRGVVRIGTIVVTWILSTGKWNDAGSWDDTSFWKDN